MKRSQKRLLACRLIAQIVSKALHARMTCSTTHTCVANDYPLRLILKYIFCGLVDRVIALKCRKNDEKVE